MCHSESAQIGGKNTVVQLPVIPLHHLESCEKSQIQQCLNSKNHKEAVFNAL